MSARESPVVLLLAAVLLSASFEVVAAAAIVDCGEGAAQQAASLDADSRGAVNLQSPQPPAGSIQSRNYTVELSGGVVRPRGSMQLWRGFDGADLFSDAVWGGAILGIRVARHMQFDFGMEITAPVIGPDRYSYDERLMALTQFGDWTARSRSAAGGSRERRARLLHAVGTARRGARRPEREER